MVASLSPARLSVDRHNGAFLDVLVRVRDSYTARLGWVFELEMIALCSDVLPAIFLKHLDQFAAIAFHVISVSCVSAYTQNRDKPRDFAYADTHKFAPNASVKGVFDRLQFSAKSLKRGSEQTRYVYREIQCDQ
jgi:hypothetical protein